ncbi:Hexokinase [Necator americanus]|uniref:Phosphotransferase n=1 Tax=Necator americanus TaxID=51031 RepID=W2SY78_NECAM|nr:Hexokinase [Necator americanus]ETN73816.1 Hexokinase [Necator americanus]
MAEFKLSNNTLRRMMTHMNDNMDRGLEGGLEESTIAMLPSFVPELPDGTERGKYVAMDLGGTNLRVMIMEIEPGENMRTKQFNTRMPNAAMHGTGEQRIQVEIVALINDTVGTMVAAAYEANHCDLGVIIGTGTNASYMEDAKAIIHGLANATEDYPHKQMIIDTEWGGFGDRGEAEYIFTQYDKIIDERSDHPGVNSLDKLVAGMCMGEVVRLVLDKLCTHKVLFNGNGSKILSTIGSFPTKYISEILQRFSLSVVIFRLLFNITELHYPALYWTMSRKKHFSDDCGSYSNTRQIMDELAIEDYSFSDMLLFREPYIEWHVTRIQPTHILFAAIACVLNRVRQPRMIVAIDGSTYKYHPFFDHWVTDKPYIEWHVTRIQPTHILFAAIACVLNRVRQPRMIVAIDGSTYKYHPFFDHWVTDKFKIVQTGDGSGKGAALIAAIVTRVKRAEEKRKKDEAARL